MFDVANGFFCPIPDGLNPSSNGDVFRLMNSIQICNEANKEKVTLDFMLITTLLFVVFVLQYTIKISCDAKKMLLCAIECP